MWRRAILFLLCTLVQPTLFGQAPRPKGTVFHRTVRDIAGKPVVRLDVDSTLVELREGDQSFRIRRFVFDGLVDEYSAFRHTTRPTHEFAIGQEGRSLILSFRQPAWLIVIIFCTGLALLGLGMGLLHLRRRFQRLHEERAQMLARRRLVEAGQEQERQRLARDLHDGPLQTLYALRMQMARQDPDPLQQDAMVEDISNHLRDLLNTLRAPSLAPYGLKDALNTLTHAYPDCEFTLQIASEAEAILPIEARNPLFRIAQEALSNAVRHGHATAIRVALAVDDQHVTLDIEDDGTGFDTSIPAETYSRAGHYGLVGIRERVDVLGGVLRLRSSPEGTLLRLVLPRAPHAGPGGSSRKKAGLS